MITQVSEVFGKMVIPHASKEREKLTKFDTKWNQ